MRSKPGGPEIQFNRPISLRNFFENLVHERYSREFALYQLSKCPYLQGSYPLICVVIDAGRRDEVSPAQWEGKRDGCAAAGLGGPGLGWG